MLSKLFVTFGNESHILFYAGAFFAEKNTEQINEMKRERKKSYGKGATIDQKCVAHEI